MSPKMSASEERNAVREIQRGLTDFRKYGPSPDIILIPELGVPWGFLPTLVAMSDSLGSIIVAGMDYKTHSTRKLVRNTGAIIVPNRLRKRGTTFRSKVRYFTKTYPSQVENEQLLKNGFRFTGSPVIWLFDGDRIGTFAVCICYDLMDLERLALYRKKIQHLFVLAYNKDVTSFQHIAEAAARLIFCNVVICNTGHYGGSLAIAPVHSPVNRVIYQQTGANLFGCQVFELQVRDLAEHQHTGQPSKIWKGLPPGYDGTYQIGAARSIRTAMRMKNS